ncbi:carboxymuconolactone decarboxylase family protein [Desulfofundulus thermobenzoicus]|uniref:Carboxymuconolactone decarboxylase family protein n=1 Tax=Desulfofundulus thermobenzoicus TaxID=29376 RepID=A0A6N7IRY4_9FIRM|nr:carboxymuconolactone decarboxylase family protein [Desulfofundulus thermobenzoicus]MQL51888.1 carboxymuconolactone decarboxylase family protein [Desulfofundulus thermobenzoicus]
MEAQKNGEGLSTYLEKLAQELPEVMKNFHQLHEAVVSDAALSAKQKELIAVGIAVAIRCSYCIANHVAKALQMGASRKEILEAISVAIMMGGGPAVAYATEAMKVLDTLTAEG